MPDTQEIWVDIEGYEGCYMVSSLGRIKSLEREVSCSDGSVRTLSERIMSAWSGTTSLYGRIRLYKDGTGTKFTIHRLVARHFLPDWNPDLEVNHLDGNRSNNAAVNLEMCTHSRNMEHAIAHNLKLDYGEKSANAKLTNSEAEDIRVRYHTGNVTQDMLAVEYGVCRQTVSAIIRYKKYFR